MQKSADASGITRPGFLGLTTGVSQLQSDHLSFIVPIQFFKAHILRIARRHAEIQAFRLESIDDKMSASMGEGPTNWE